MPATNWQSSVSSRPGAGTDLAQKVFQHKIDLLSERGESSLLFVDYINIGSGVNMNLVCHVNNSEN
jgi:hypothetical protein